MKRFTYTVSDPQGLHARNAISLCRLAGDFAAHIFIRVQEGGQQRTADCKDMMALMGLKIRQNTTVEISIEGEDESSALDILVAALPTIM